jgi:hypothetical protein
VLDLAVPDAADAVHQVLDADRGIVRQAELPERHLEMAAVGMVRIEIDGEQQEVVELCRHLAVVEDVVVAGVVGLEVPELPQRRMLAPEPFEERDVVAGVAGPVPVPGADLVLLAVEILFLDSRC